MASGGALLFGVNTWCLDGRGALWRDSLPVSPRLAFFSRVVVLMEVLLCSASRDPAAGRLRAGRPTVAEVVALLCSTLVVSLQVVSAGMRWSIARPFAVDLRSARATPAPPVVMAGYSARLAVATTFTGLIFSGLAQLERRAVRPQGRRGVPCWSGWRLRAATRRWEDPVVRSRVVATVAWLGTGDESPQKSIRITARRSVGPADLAQAGSGEGVDGADVELLPRWCGWVVIGYASSARAPRLRAKSTAATASSRLMPRSSKSRPGEQAGDSPDVLVGRVLRATFPGNLVHAHPGPSYPGARLDRAPADGLRSEMGHQATGRIRLRMAAFGLPAKAVPRVPRPAPRRTTRAERSLYRWHWHRDAGPRVPKSVWRSAQSASLAGTTVSSAFTRSILPPPIGSERGTRAPLSAADADQGLDHLVDVLC